MAVARPCPFCKNKRMDFWDYEKIFPEYTISVFCGQCGARGPKAHSKEDAIKAWNEGVQ